MADSSNDHSEYSKGKMSEKETVGGENSVSPFIWRIKTIICAAEAVEESQY